MINDRLWILTIYLQSHDSLNFLGYICKISIHKLVAKINCKLWNFSLSLKSLNISDFFNIFLLTPLPSFLYNFFRRSIFDHASIWFSAVTVDAPDQKRPWYQLRHQGLLQEGYELTRNRMKKRKVSLLFILKRYALHPFTWNKLIDRSDTFAYSIVFIFNFLLFCVCILYFFLFHF